ncbi:MAG: protein kinase [Agarilytica sp.]
MTLEIPGYEVFESIGEGGMAQVYRARHLRLDREVALKIMLPRFAKDASFGERFIREARIAANLNHQNIVQIYDVSRVEGTLFLSMEYVPGGDLTDKIKQPEINTPYTGLDKQSVIDVIRDLAIALDYAHDRGYVHRDIKPANILFREDNSLALSDFGIARAIHSDTHMTQTGMVIGTPSYMSPEQAQGKPLTGSSDLYSVAVIAYQLITGQLPYQSESSISVAIKHINAPIPTLGKPLSTLQSFFDRALAKTPEQRFTNGQEMAKAFDSALAAIDKLPAQTIQNDNTQKPSQSLNTHSADYGITETHQNLDAFSIDTSDLSELETEVLPRDSENNQCILGHDIPIQRPPAEHALSSDNAYSYTKSHDQNVMPSHRTTVQLVIMQINRFKVFVTHINKSYTLLSFVLLTGIVSGLYVLNMNGVLKPKATLSPGQTIRLTQLLERADADLAKNHLVQPLGNNAYEKYLAILAISPNDPVALNGINAIAETLATQTEQALNNGNLLTANKTLRHLKEISPKHSKYRLLAERVTLIEETHAEEIQTTLNEAAMAYDAGDISTAVNKYNDVLEGPKDNEEASLALRSIIDHEFISARTAIKKQQPHLAKNAAENIHLALATETNEKVLKQHQIPLETLSIDIRQLEKSIEKRKKVSSLIKRGEVALSKKQLIQPQTENAHSFFTQALSLSPNNAQAKEGIRQVFAQLKDSTQTYINQGDVKLAQTYLSKLEQLAPNNDALPSLKTKLKHSIRQNKINAAKRKKIATLHKRASIYLADGRAKSADKIYTQITRIAPEDPNLPTLAMKIADGYAVLAQAEINAKDWRDVSVWVTRGLKHVPDHETLHALQAIADQHLK